MKFKAGNTYECIVSKSNAYKVGCTYPCYEKGEYLYLKGGDGYEDKTSMLRSGFKEYKKLRGIKE